MILVGVADRPGGAIDVETLPDGSFEIISVNHGNLAAAFDRAVQICEYVRTSIPF